MESEELHHPNINFFSDYGSIEDPNSRLSKSPILIVRHAQSEYNAADA